jgi:hypothetical protein
MHQKHAGQVRAAVLSVAVLYTRRHRVQVSAASKLVPVAHAAEIRPSSRGNLLRQLLSANVDADLYGKELVRAVINVSMHGVSIHALGSVLPHLTSVKSAAFALSALCILAHRCVQYGSWQQYYCW